jgi:hypothetical protein
MAASFGFTSQRHTCYNSYMRKTLEDIRRRANHVLDTQGWDAVALRKQMVTIANLAHAELEARAAAAAKGKDR